MSVHSVPKTAFSDNGTQFSSQTLHDFATTWDFCHVTSSPEYPQANDLAERAVRSTQRLLETSKRDGTDLLLVLLNIRNVPRDTTLGSPAQHLLSRRTRTTPPASQQLLIPSSKYTAMVRVQLSKKRQMQKGHDDKSSRPLPPLKQSQMIRLQTTKGHDKIGVIKKKCDEHRSYIVESQGKEYRRNRRHILPVAEPQHLLDQDECVPSALTGEPDRDDTQVATEEQPTVVAPAVKPPRQSQSPYHARSERISKPNTKYID